MQFVHGLCPAIDSWSAQEFMKGICHGLCIAGMFNLSTPLFVVRNGLIAGYTLQLLSDYGMGHIAELLKERSAMDEESRRESEIWRLIEIE